MSEFDFDIGGQTPLDTGDVARTDEAVVALRDAGFGVVEVNHIHRDSPEASLVFDLVVKRREVSGNE